MSQSPFSKRYEAILNRVQKPGRYIGGEVNAVVKDWGRTPLKVALVFPDSYEIAMSYMGQQVLYEVLNQEPEILAERVYAPWPDMEQALREEGVPILSLESRRPLKDFDLIAITVPYELTYTNVLTILDLSGIPFFSRDRDSSYPWIISGGTSAYNPEPYADFMDAIGIGDGEELILQIAERCLRWKQLSSRAKRGDLTESIVTGGLPRRCAPRNDIYKYHFLNQLKEIQGVYIPAFFQAEYFESGRLKAMVPLVAGYTGVKKAIVSDLDRAPYPSKMLVPNVGVVHDRIGIEVQRGCTRACRFCQAGYIERPTRQRSPERVSEIAQAAARATGKEEISLLSLSVGDYGCVSPLLNHLNTAFENRSMSVSIPATRTETLTPAIIREIKKVRQTGFTIAPEAGTARMRRVINKGNEVTDLLRTADNVFKEGWRLIKLYYLMGLPTETDLDLRGIVEEAVMVQKIGRQYTQKPTLNVSVSSFVPKPFTPFQWHGQDRLADNRRKQEFFHSEFKKRPGLMFKYHDAGMSLVEGLFSRGDRRLAPLLVEAYRLGCRMDEWGEHFSFEKWQQAIQNTGIDIDFYVYRQRDLDEVLPWDHLFTQMKKDFLLREYQGALDEAYVADCSMHKCEDCGICDFREIKNRVYLPSADAIVFKKGNRLGKGSTLGVSPSPYPSPTGGEGKERKNGIFSTPSPLRGEGWGEGERKIHRIRVRYAKRGPAAFIGHLDMVKHLKRAIRRVDTPVLYSQGFHPQMRLALGNPLKLGKESDGEYFDLYLSEPLDIDAWIEAMNSAVPLGLRVMAGEEIPLKTPSIQVTMQAELCAT